MKMIRIALVVALVGAGVARLAATSPDLAKTRHLLGIVQSDSPLAERARALQQLTLVASPEAVPALVPLLADARLGQYARDVLEQMPDASAGEALRTALGRLEGRPLIGVVNSLGLRRDALAVGVLSRLAVDRASPAAEAALSALGRIATPEAIRVVEEVAVRGPAELRGAAAEACLVGAERLLEQGQRTAALALLAAVRRADVPSPVRLAAIRGALLAAAADDLTLLLEQLRSNDPARSDLALLTMRELRGTAVTPVLVRELDRLDPAMQARVIAALVDRGDPGLIDGAEARAKAGNEEVRVAAIKALGKIGRPSSIAILLQMIQAAPAPAIVEAALASLAEMAVPATNATILQALATAQPALQIQLIGVLGERKAALAIPELLRLTRGSEPDVSKAAWRALSLAARTADLPELIQQAAAVQDETVRILADRAIVTTAMKELQPQLRAGPVLLAFRRASDAATKEALLRPLGAIVRLMGGSHEVFFAVRGALKDPSGAVRSAALQCLADWPDATPTTTLLELANQEAITPEQRETALRGAIRMAAHVATGRERSPLNFLESFVQANRAVRTRAEKLMIVSGLGSVKRTEALAMLQPYLDDPEVQGEAALAVVQIASAMAAAQPAAATKAILEKIAAMAIDEELRRKAARLVSDEPVRPAKGAPKAQPDAGGPAAAGPLFNGKDLSGWDGDPAIWRVRDGLIVGGSPEGNPRSEFLASKRRFRNFVLSLDYKLVGTKGCNSGVQFRSVRVAQPPYGMIGYQADIGAGHSGCLYDESRRKRFLTRAPAELIQRLEKPGDWNRYEIRCDGPRVELRLNGELTVTYLEEDPGIPAEGLIALQLHGNCKGEIEFRQISLEQLP